jgi:hypothetical protein
MLIDMNIRLSVGGILCDLNKAFDCVDHGIIVDKLEFSGISGKFQTLTQSYLRVRLKKVLIATLKAYDGVSSRWKRVINGVPGCLMLGSLLLLIYFNDLPKITDNDAKTVLNDTSIRVTTSNQEEVQTIYPKHSLISHSLKPISYL